MDEQFLQAPLASTSYSLLFVCIGLWMDLHHRSILHTGHTYDEYPLWGKLLDNSIKLNTPRVALLPRLSQAMINNPFGERSFHQIEYP